VEQTKEKADEEHLVEIEKLRQETHQQIGTFFFQFNFILFCPVNTPYLTRVEKMKDGIAKNVELLIHQYEEDIDTMKREFERTLQDSLKREEEMRHILEDERTAREEEFERLKLESESKIQQQLNTHPVMEDSASHSLKSEESTATANANAEKI
jgi:hypothetical protein